MREYSVGKTQKQISGVLNNGFAGHLRPVSPGGQAPQTPPNP